MKTAEELKTLKEEVETLNKKLAELTEEELAQVSGGFAFVPMICDTCNHTTLWNGYYSGMYECPKCKCNTLHAVN